MKIDGMKVTKANGDNRFYVSAGGRYDGQDLVRRVGDSLVAPYDIRFRPVGSRADWVDRRVTVWRNVGSWGDAVACVKYYINREIEKIHGHLH